MESRATCMCLPCTYLYLGWRTLMLSSSSPGRGRGFTLGFGTDLAYSSAWWSLKKYLGEHCGICILCNRARLTDQLAAVHHVVIERLLLALTRSWFDDWRLVLVTVAFVDGASVVELSLQLLALKHKHTVNRALTENYVTSRTFSLTVSLSTSGPSPPSLTS